MKTICLCVLFSSFTLSGADKAQPVRRSSEPAPRPPTIRADTNSRPTTRRLVYRPPRLGLPKVTAACGTRESRVETLQLSVMAPEHVGWTTRPAPVLLWHHSGPLRWPLEATLVVRGRPEPILQLPLESVGEWHRLDLARHHVELELGVTYQWAVAAVVDSGSRSKDLVADGAIQRVEPPEALAAQCATLPVREQILQYASNGFWYDAVSLLATELEEAPQDPELWRWCMSLCEQGGLVDLAADLRRRDAALWNGAVPAPSHRD